jgi:hypothetical protein
LLIQLNLFEQSGHGGLILQQSPVVFAKVGLRFALGGGELFDCRECWHIEFLSDPIAAADEIKNPDRGEDDQGSGRVGACERNRMPSRLQPWLQFFLSLLAVSHRFFDVGSCFKPSTN